MLIDTHTHIYLSEDFPDAEAVYQRAIDAGVCHMVLPNVDLHTIDDMLKMHARHPDTTSVAIGLHPTEINDNYRADLDAVLNQLDSSGDANVVAIGEIGIDLYWDKTYRAEQRDAFATQCRVAVERNLPVIIHCREGLDDTLDVLSAMEKAPRGVFHSFGGTCEDVDRIRAVGDFYFGINGIVTFKNSKLRDVLHYIGIDRLLLETDSPYLAPVPYRGKRNESAYVAYVADTVAKALGVDLAEVADRTSANAANLFRIFQTRATT
jgi:TatD DNase family protein